MLIPNPCRRTMQIVDFTEEITMSFGLYLLGYLFVIGGLTYGATLMHVPVRWITAIDIVLAGIGIVTAVKATRQKDASN